MNMIINNLPKNFNVRNFNTLNNQKSNNDLNYIKNLSADTVTFTGMNDAEKRVRNSARVFERISNDDYYGAYKFLKDMSEDNKKWHWDPNYVDVNPQRKKKTSLMGLLIRKYATAKESYDRDVIRDIIDIVVLHNDYMPINPITNEDFIKIAINTLDRAKLKDFFDTNVLMADNVDEAQFDEYIRYAKAKNKDNIIDQIERLKKIAFEDFDVSQVKTAVDSKQMKGAEAAMIKEELELRETLSKYRVLPLENDPKSLDDVGGMFKAKEEIREFIIKPWDKDFRQRIIENKLNRPSGFLLSGPPGCGKTYIMKAIAAETGYPLYEINLANVGVSEAYKMQSDLKKLFDNFEKLYKLTGEPSILILDEFDSIAMNRQNVSTDWKKDDINALLMVLNNSAQKGIIVVGATNNPKDLDEAATRPGRLDRQISIEKPDAAERRDILGKLLIGKPIAQKLVRYIDEMTAETDDMTPAQISTIVNTACLHAIYDRKEFVDMDDFKQACEKIKSNSDITKSRRKIVGFKN